MKIVPGLPPLQPVSGDARPADASSTRSAASEQTPVTLSARAKGLNQLENHLDSQSVVDRARVDSIKATLIAGQHTINSESIADTLLTSAQKILHGAK